MNMQRILIAVDGSESSKRALEHGLALAGGHGARILLLHCRRPVPPSLGAPNDAEFLAHAQAEAESVLGPLRARAAQVGVPFDHMIVAGPAAEAIVDVAEAEACDLVVLGSRGLSQMQGLILGSVTHKVLHATDRHVLVVP